MSKPTPTHHGSWRVIDGQLVDESAGSAPRPAVPAPAAAAAADPADDTSPPAAKAARKNKPDSKE